MIMMDSKKVTIASWGENQQITNLEELPVLVVDTEDLPVEGALVYVTRNYGAEIGALYKLIPTGRPLMTITVPTEVTTNQEGQHYE